jgi:hypothetical protein
VERSVQDNGLRAALTRVDLGGRTLARVAAGESMAGVPANLRMNFRIGSIAIPYVIDLLLQLQDKGRLSLDDPVSNWLPDLPNANRVTLRMLANSTSGYADWIQENPDFVATLFADVFRQWQTSELLQIALARPRLCEPGACFHYAHTNFVILGMVIEKVTGRPMARLIRTRVLRPLGLRNTPFRNGSPLGQAVFTIIAAIAQLERSLRVERVKAGLRRARDQAKHIGRPRLLVDSLKLQSVMSRRLPSRVAAKELGVSQSAYLRLARAHTEHAVSSIEAS